VHHAPTDPSAPAPALEPHDRTDREEVPSSRRPTRRHALLGAVTVAGGAALSACGLGGSSGSGSPVAAQSSDTMGSDSASAADDASGSADAQGTSSAGADPMNTDATTKAAAAPTKAAHTASPRSNTAESKAAQSKAAQSKAAQAKAAKAKAAQAAAAKGALTKLSRIPVGGSITVGSVIIARPSGNHVVGHSNVCTHEGCKVPAGGRKLICPCHEAVFDAFSGKNLSGPAPTPLAAVRLVVRDGYVHRA
jgi:Rieske Fe-S protein